MLFRKKMITAIKRNSSSQTNTLIAGPWVGEFGWELFCWQAYLRARSKEFDRVVVASRPAMEPLYRDFCHEFIPYEPAGPGVSGYKNLEEKEWHDPTDGRDFREYISGKFHIGFNRAKPQRSAKAFAQQDFKQYGSVRAELKFDIVLHIRQTDKKGSGWRNGWQLDGWQEFLTALQATGDYRICCIGHPQQAGILPGCEDQRGIALDQTFDLLASSRLLAGPSSGPMHLGALCGCPHVVWSGEHGNQPKYEHYWNPFKTPVDYIHDETWTPSVELAVERVCKMYQAQA